jgi:succinate-acetate transporter protein
MELDGRGYETVMATGTVDHTANNSPVPPRRDDDVDALEDYWTDRARIVLTPVAAPTILGLLGFMTAATMLGAWMAGWYGSTTTPDTIWPFALTAGGIAQLLAGMWCYRARDGVGTAVHGLWGSFWVAWGILAAFSAVGLHPALRLSGDTSFAWWFIVIGAITFMGALAALAQSVALFVALGVRTGGAVLAALAFYNVGGGTMFTVTGWVLVIAAGASFYTASALMLAESFGRTVLPIGTFSKAANVPGRRPNHSIEYPLGLPGSKVGL